MFVTKRLSMLAIFCMAAGALLYASRDWSSSASVRYSSEYLHEPQGAAVRIAVDGPEQIVLSADDQHCLDLDAMGRRMDVPDAPLRAIRTTHELLAVAAHYNNLAYTGKSLAALARRDCNSLMASRLDGDPSHFSDHEWLVSMYVRNDRIFGLVHDEYWGGLYSPSCRERLGRRDPWADVCLYGNLTGAVSIDGGRTFERADDVAAYPFAFSEDMKRNGIRDPSNLFFNPNDGFVYFMSWVDPKENQTGGECLFRSRDPFLEPWLAWNGHYFGAKLGSPYKNQATTCEPVSGLWITTVVYSEAARAFVALAYDERIKPGGVFYRTSTDLVHWSKAELIMEAHNQKYWKKNNTQGPIVYPSLIDPESMSPNFDTISSRPYLYFIRWRVRNGQPQGRERDIVRVPLKLSVADSQAVH